MGNTEQFDYRNSELFVEDIPVSSITKNVGTPVFVYSEHQLKANFTNLDSAFSKFPHLVCYALKANNNLVLCNVLSKLNAGADITSGGELYAAIKSNIPANKIVYAGVGKRSDEIKSALSKNVLMLNVESLAEMRIIASLADQLRTRARIAFRYNPNIDAHTHKFITTGKSENKFGLPEPLIYEAYKEAVKYKSLDVVGIHVHIGSQITELKPFELAAKKVLALYKTLSSIGIKIKYIDMGGGLGIKYFNEVPPNPKSLADIYISTFKNLPNITLILEPGRFIVGNTAILVTSVLYNKETLHKKFLIVDSGMCDLIRPAFYDAYHEILPLKKSSKPKVTVDVVGPVCETSDFLGKDRMLPLLNSGDLLAVKTAGAYGFAMSSNYNARPRAAEVLVSGNKWRLIRYRETINNIFGKICK